MAVAELLLLFIYKLSYNAFHFEDIRSYIIVVEYLRKLGSCPTFQRREHFSIFTSIFKYGLTPNTWQSLLTL